MAISPLPLRRLPILTTALLILIGLILLTIISLASDTGQRLVAQLASRALSSPASRVSIGRLEGLISPDITIRDIALADREGAWLYVDGVRIRWKPLALLRFRLSIDTLDVDRVEVFRKPVSNANESRASRAEPFSPPRLPVSFEVAQVSVANLVTDAPVLGMPARFSATGATHLTSQGLGFMLDGERLDRFGKLAARLDFAPADLALRTSLRLDEPDGGILAELAGLPDWPPVTLTFDGDGTLDAFRAKLAFHAGPAIRTDGTLTLDKAGTVRALTLDVAAHLPSVSFERMTVKAKITPAGTAADLFAVDTEAETSGLKLGNAALAEAVGQEIRLTMQGSGSLTGPAHVESLRITAPALSANFKGEVATHKVKGRLEAEMPNLSRFGKLAGLALQGEAKLGADLEGAPPTRRFIATIDAATRRLATGVAQINGLIGGEARLTGGVSYDPDAGIRFDNLGLFASQSNAHLDGAANNKAADITARLTISSLEKTDKRLSGRGEAQAHITGTLDHPDATLSAEVRNGALLGRAVPRLILEAHGTDLLGPFDAEANLDGSIGGKTAQGRAHFIRLSNNEIRLDPLDVKFGSFIATGAVMVDRDWLASGKLTLHGLDLDDLSPLLLEKLAGTIDADLTLTRDGSRQNVALAAKFQKLAGFGMGIEKLSADLTASDLYQRPAVTGFAEVAGARIGGETIKRLGSM
jgi:autotransporter translocation and assembly factor TamB